MYFNAGLEHAQRDELPAAIDAFERAYRTSPNYAVLYNLGTAYLAVGRRADAVRTFERFLAEGDDLIDAARRAAVEATIAHERASLGVLELALSPREAEVYVDGRRLPSDAATAELDPGEHVVLGYLQGYRPALVAIRLEAGHTEHARLTLEPAAPSPLGTASHAVTPPSAPRPPTPLPAPTVPRSSAVAQRQWALGLGLGGVALAGTAAGIFVWNTDRYRAWQADRARLDASIAGGGGDPGIVTQDAALTRRAVGLERADAFALDLAVAAGAALASAAVLWFISKPAPAAPRYGQALAH